MGEEVQQEEQKQEPVAQEFVFCGVRIGKSGKKQYLWARVAEPDNPMWFSKPLVTASVGGVYTMGEVRGADNRTTVYSAGNWSPKYERRYNRSEEEKAHSTRWAVADEATRQELSNKAMLTKAAKVEPLEDLITRVQDIAQHLNKTERRALMARLSEACWL